MQSVRVAIVGGGLAGLYAAFLLEQRGFRDYVLIEARDALGGRIASVSAPERQSVRAIKAFDRFDLGPTWFWPDFQPELGRLVSDLGLRRFVQFETGDMMVEHSANEPAVRMGGYASSPASMRVIGGMGALIEALRQRIGATRIVTGMKVRGLSAQDSHVVVGGIDPIGRVLHVRADHVLLAVPPRVVESSIAFSPPLPEPLRAQWRSQPTWMAPHAKYVAIYDTAFWRKQGLSGEARSTHGPLGEIHDASMPGGSAALFGFFAIPARIRKNVAEDVLRAHCRAQLARLFGPQAAAPMAESLKDWALDPYTATASDQEGATHSSGALAATAASGLWSGRLTGIASEWSHQFPGYLAGAVEAADLGVKALPLWADVSESARPVSLEQR
jgi:monoamine oxidase